MPQIANPISTEDDSGGWTLVGGTDIHECIDEGVDAHDSDTSIVSFAQFDGEYFRVKFASCFQPDDYDEFKVRIVARRRGLAIQHPELKIEWYEGSTLIENLGNVVIDVTTHTLFEVTLSEAAAESLTDYSNIQVKVTIDKNTGNTGDVRITALGISLNNTRHMASTIVSPDSRVDLSLIQFAGHSEHPRSSTIYSTTRSALVSAVTLLQSSWVLQIAEATVNSRMFIAVYDADVESRFCYIGSQGRTAFLIVNPGQTTGLSIATPASRFAFLIVSPGTILDPVTIHGRSSMALRPLDGFYVWLSNTLRDLVSTISPTTTYYEAQKFEPPVGSSWIHVKYDLGDENTWQVEFTEVRVNGELILRIHVPIQQGDATALAFAGTLFNYFNNLAMYGIRFRAPYIAKRGRWKEFWLVQLNCPFIVHDYA